MGALHYRRSEYSEDERRHERDERSVDAGPERRCACSFSGAFWQATQPVSLASRVRDRAAHLDGGGREDAKGIAGGNACNLPAQTGIAKGNGRGAVLVAGPSRWSSRGCSPVSPRRSCSIRSPAPEALALGQSASEPPPR